MFLIAFIALAVLAVPASGGKLSQLCDLRLKGTRVIFAALALQVVIISLLPSGQPGLHQALHIASYAIAAVFVAMNWRIFGMPLIALGGACNALAIVANKGVMPASQAALRAAGELHAAGEFANSTVVAHPRLLFLGDVFAIPASWPLHNVFSIGDVLIGIGVAMIIHALSGSRLVRGAWKRRAIAGANAA